MPTPRRSLSRRTALVIGAAPARPLAHRLASAGFVTRQAESAEKARAELDDPSFDLVLADPAVLDRAGNARLARLAAERRPVTGVLAGGEGAATPPDRPCALLRLGPLIGASPPMQDVYDQVLRVAPTTATTFLIGESGTGKELAAQLLHDLSDRAGAPCVPVNCGALAPELVESELFGHEKGSFTGASRRHAGIFERAHGGTVFLDEITEMPLALQVRLLRALEEGCVRRVGGDDPVKVDVRVLAATNRDPEQAVSDGTLRRDLYYRLFVFPIRMPPLRERPGDVEAVARHALQRLNRKAELPEPKHLAPEALERLSGRAWSGNVRELQNVVERAFILCDGERIGPECIALEDPPQRDPERPSPVAVRRPRLVAKGPEDADSVLRVQVGMSVAEVERRMITAELERTGDDKAEAARRLGISVKTLYTRIAVYRAGERVRARQAS